MARGTPFSYATVVAIHRHPQRGGVKFAASDVKRVRRKRGRLACLSKGSRFTLALNAPPKPEPNPAERPLSSPNGSPRTNSNSVEEAANDDHLKGLGRLAEAHEQRGNQHDPVGKHLALLPAAGTEGLKLERGSGKLLQ